MSGSAARDDRVERPHSVPPHKVGRERKRLQKRVFKKADGRYLIYFERAKR